MSAASYSGDNAAAASANLASPAAVAYDSNGNLFVADRDHHVIRELLKSSGNIITIAGTGIAGFAGDGSAATAAYLNTPSCVVVDSAGNLYIPLTTDISSKLRQISPQNARHSARSCHPPCSGLSRMGSEPASHGE